VFHTASEGYKIPSGGRHIHKQDTGKKDRIKKQKEKENIRQER